MCKISVLVTTYNQPIQGIFATLNSVLGQDFDDFEIVIADDCSSDSPKLDLMRYFKERSFDRYKLVMNQENLGTVLNIVEGMKVAEGEFVKDIGAGDLLFERSTLAKIYDFAKKENANLGFGRIMTYSGQGGALSVNRFNAPSNPLEYGKDSDSGKLAEHQLVSADWIPGGSLFFRRDFLIEYLMRLSTDYGVRYCEDLVSPLVSFEEPILFLDEYLLWYEWGVGISNSGSAGAKNRMYTDHGNFFDGLARDYPESIAIRKAKRRFKVKRFLALKTPLYALARIVGSVHYLSHDAEGVEGPGKDALAFLETCRSGASH